MRMPERPPEAGLGESLSAVLDVLGRTSPLINGRYRHWDTVRRLSPPAGVTTEQWWHSARMARRYLSQDLPLQDSEGAPFTWATPGPMLEMLHRVDQRASGEVVVPELVANPEQSRRYLINSLTEEAITSSQLEGANTTRRVAKEMLRSGRAPTTKGEHMILNNYNGLDFIREHRDARLTPDLVLRLHAVLTENTLEPTDVGRLQRPDEERVVVCDVHGNVLHTPPPAEQLQDRLVALCAFANGERGPEGFLHPVVRATLVHFWLAYDHPFVDGNGRTARALFYWSMLREGYWLTEYLSISRILRRAPAKYGRAFLYTETDENDTTYFVLYQLGVICRAIDDLHVYLARKMQQIQEVERVLRASASFNTRQLALLGHAMRHSDAAYTFESHRRSHGIVYQSARNDLLDLVERGLLAQHKIGRRFVFYPTPALRIRLGA